MIVMKKTSLICLSVLFALGVAPVSSGEAARRGKSEHTPVDKILEYSIERLKGSVEKSAQQNERLSYENTVLRQSIDELKALEKSLTASKAALVGEGGSHDVREIAASPELADMGYRKKKTKELIAALQKDIEYVEARLEDLEKRLDDDRFRAYKKELTRNRELRQKDLVETERKLTDLKYSNTKVSDQIEGLVQEQNELLSKINELQFRQRGF